MSADLPPLTLYRAPVGDRLRITGVGPTCPDCVRLRELGFQEGAEVRKITCGSAIICSLMGTRIAIGCEMSQHVHVERISA